VQLLQVEPGPGAATAAADGAGGVTTTLSGLVSDRFHFVKAVFSRTAGAARSADPATAHPST
jgi:hypothetical protein